MARDEVDQLLKRQAELQQELASVRNHLDQFRVKCPGCRCRILPGSSCACCASYVTIDEDDNEEVPDDE